MKKNLNIVTLIIFILFWGINVTGKNSSFNLNSNNEFISNTSSKQLYDIYLSEFVDNFSKISKKQNININLSVLSNYISYNYKIDLAKSFKSNINYNYFLGNDKSRWRNLNLNYDTLSFSYENNIIKFYSDNNNILFDFNGSKDKFPLNLQLLSNSNINTFLFTDSIDTKRIIFSEIFGGNDYDIVEDMKSDIKKNIIICGSTSSIDFPITSDAIMKSIHKNGDHPDIFVTKFDSTGKNILFSTYIGGFLDDFPKKIYIDKKNNIIITGYTGPSESFPKTLGVYDTLNRGGFDVFVLKLNPTGDTLLFSTLISSPKDDFANSLDLDSIGNIYITGYTSDDVLFPTTSSAYKRVGKGKNEAFISKLDSLGKKLLASTYFGGSENEFATDIKVFKSEVYITGSTYSNDLPIYSTSFQLSSRDSGSIHGECFIAKFTDKLDVLKTNTYYGGKSAEIPYSMLITQDDNLIITGTTESDDLITTSDALDANYNTKSIDKGKGDVFILKSSLNLDTIIYSSYFGGNGADCAMDIKEDSKGNLYFTGFTNSRDLQVSNFAYMKKYNDTATLSDAFLLKTNQAMSKIRFSTYIGGKGKDIGKSLLVNDNQEVIIAGTTISNNFIITDSTLYKNVNDSTKLNIFLIKLNTQYLGSIRDTNIFDEDNEIKICSGDTVYYKVKIDGGEEPYTITWKPNTTADFSNPLNPKFFPKSTELYYLTIKDNNNLIAFDTIKINAKNAPFMKINGPKVALRYTKQPFNTTIDPNYKYTWRVRGGNIIGSNETDKITVEFTDSLSTEIDLIINTIFGCSDSIIAYKVVIGIDNKPRLRFTNQSVYCDGDTVNLKLNLKFAKYFWSTGETTPSILVTKGGAYYLQTIDSLGFTGYSDTASFYFFPRLPKPNIRLIVPGNYLQCLDNAPTYEWWKNDSTIKNGNKKSISVTGDGVYRCAVVSPNGCKTFSDSIVVILNSVNEELIDDFEISSLNSSIIINYSSINIPDKIEIFDILGNLFCKFEDANTTFTRFNNFTPGVYLIKINKKNQLFIKKVIIY